MELSDLQRIGLTAGETKVYEALLELGETTRTELAKKSGISPSKIYDVANRLLEKGIIASVKKNGVLHFSAADPRRLTAFIEQKEAEILKERTLIDALLPQLTLKYAKTEENADVEVFTGWAGMKTVFDDIVRTLEKNECNYIFGASRGYDSRQADIFFAQYYQKKRKKGFGTRIIFNEDVRGNAARTATLKGPRDEMRFLHQETFTEINTYRDTVLLIMLLKKPLVIRVRNKEAAKSFKAFFDSLWAQARP